MEYVGLVVVAALVQYFLFAFNVAAVRERERIPATEATDNERLVRLVRVHANTGEMLIVFVPMIALCGHFFDPHVAAGVGAFWILARLVYRRGYLKDVRSRIPGFYMGDIVLALLTVGTLYGIGRKLI